MNIDLLKNMSWEKKQTIAAKCFENYCEYFCIRDDIINKLVEHLYSMEQYRNEYHDLATWEKNGAGLELAGRGDPLPEMLKQKIPNEKINEFNEILEYTVEVGLCDMYSASTNNPLEYLIKCINILRVNSVQLPYEIVNIFLK